MISEQGNKVLDLAQEKGVIRPCDLDKIQVPRRYLHRLYQQGYFERLDWGLYTLKSEIPSANRTILESAQAIPEGVICLLSALNLHGLTTQQPHEVWVAVQVKARRPDVKLPVRVIRSSGRAFRAGITRKQIEGIRVRVYNPAKTVADCFKYRNKIGKEVAIEALKDCLRQKLCTVEDLWRYAKICRVANVMRPYLEAVV